MAGGGEEKIIIGQEYIPLGTYVCIHDALGIWCNVYYKFYGTANDTPKELRRYLVYFFQEIVNLRERQSISYLN